MGNLDEFVRTLVLTRNKTTSQTGTAPATRVRLARNGRSWSLPQRRFRFVAGCDRLILYETGTAYAASPDTRSRSRMGRGKQGGGRRFDDGFTIRNGGAGSAGVFADFSGNRHRIARRSAPPPARRGRGSGGRGRSRPGCRIRPGRRERRLVEVAGPEAFHEVAPRVIGQSPWRGQHPATKGLRNRA